MKHFSESPYSPPTVKEYLAEVGEDVLNALVELGRLMEVAPEVVFRKEDYDRMVQDVRIMIQENGELTIAKARDHFNTSRRYMLPFLEHLDAIRVTVRNGDIQKLKNKN